MMEELGLADDAVRGAGENDFVIAVRASGREAFEAAMAKTKKEEPDIAVQKPAFSTVEEAVHANPRAISAPSPFPANTPAK